MRKKIKLKNRASCTAPNMGEEPGDISGINFPNILEFFQDHERLPARKNGENYQILDNNGGQINVPDDVQVLEDLIERENEINQWQINQLERCYVAEHTEKRIKEIIPATERMYEPVIRCTGGKHESVEIPQRSLYRINKVANKFVYRERRMTVFLHDAEKSSYLKVSKIVANEYGENDGNLPANKYRIFVASYNMSPFLHRLPQSVQTYAYRVHIEATSAYLHLMGTCGWKTASFRAYDEPSRIYCENLLDSARQSHSVLTSSYADNNGEHHIICHFYEWLKNNHEYGATKRHLELIPYFHGDFLPEIMESALRKRANGQGMVDEKNIWRSINDKLKSKGCNNYSFMAPLSYQKPDLARCSCCQSVQPCKYD